MNLVQKMFDSSDSSFELHDVAGVILIMTLVGMALHSTYLGVPVSLQEFGTGGAALIAAIGGAGWMKGRQRAIDPTCERKDDRETK